MKALVADTHSAIWFLAKSPDISSVARQAMRDAADAGEPIYVSAIIIG
ncbi:hypothetical protein BH20ACI1_BH20ACI1_26940 [soil metagenome]